MLAYAWTAGACLQVALLRRTLDTDRSQRLAEELTEVGASRTRLVESFDSERRRIERDLHDGAQQRLVTLAMGLGRDPDGGRRGARTPTTRRPSGSPLPTSRPRC